MSLVNIIKKYDIEALIMDFDNTITTKNSSTSFGVFNNQFDSEYREIKRELDRKTVNNYDELELLDIWNTKLKLLEKYYDNKILKEVRDEFVIRKDFFELYDYLNENSIKLIICSSGFRPLIKYILNENNIYNYELFANDFSTNSEDVITPMNKNKFLKNIGKNIIVGDQFMDLTMANENTILKVGIDILKKDRGMFDFVITGGDMNDGSS